MRAEEFLTEAATDVVYHYTSVANAEKIVTSGEFLLASVTGSKAEQQYAPPGYPYFLSTSRSKVGDYHRYIGNSGVMFVLDGQWLSQRYPVKPIDYWDRSWLHSDGTRTREAEDRVFSKDNAISTACVRAIHVLIKEQHEYQSPKIRSILLTAKRQGIPAFLYTDERAWLLQDTRKSVSPTQAPLKGPQPAGRSYGRDYLEPWIELIMKKRKEDLSPAGEKLWKNLMYYGNYAGEDNGLGTDMGNARKPGSTDYPSAVKLNTYMRQHGIKSTEQLRDLVRDKWTAIAEKEREQNASK